MNVNLPLEQSLGRLLAVAILLFSAIILSVGNVDLKDLGLVVISSVLGILAISPLLGEDWRPCDIFKCGPFDAIYTGPFRSENALAIFACVTVLFVFLVHSKLHSLLSLAPICLALYATESRTSQMALFAALGAWVLSLVWKKLTPSGFVQGVTLQRSLRAQTVMFSVAVLAILATAFVLILTAVPTSFSNRGNIWIRGMGALGEDWFVGLGLDRWTYLQTIGVVPPLFPHSQYLLLLFGGGVLSVGLMMLMFCSAMSRARRLPALFSFTVAYVLFLAVLGLTEAYWNPIAFDGHTLLVLPFILIATGRRRAQGPDAGPGSNSHRRQMNTGRLAR
ncbi:O-antigen ligase family protein [Paenarthrobacter nicotinovorans]|uniref:O-antigen ligase family protein n=1 Tax=Paenarthrobacter nicotinovorans TaxID=29320 RepID=UPI003D66E575